ncbi:uncharacterized protein LOC124720507 isoform X2 [Schistocerca piceifrons]|uniref:uncharacterized protein LOC124720507 isoform X2 n=1 Tax=Schistocerca piceifrons TaxID=274613 RepID=UPI001F5EDAFC|nr:uncharacterized protein LOC124720507 isoform X2 [Schistocerca piceifrons]
MYVSSRKLFVLIVGYGKGARVWQRGKGTRSVRCRSSSCGAQVPMLVLCTGGGKIEAHGVILAARNPVVTAVLVWHDTAETASDCVHILDIETTVVNHLVRYVSVVQLLAAADKYDPHLLKEPRKDRCWTAFKCAQ